jgi:hypothetical protein
VGHDPRWRPRDEQGRFTPVPTGTVRVRQADGSARTYRIERDPRTGALVEQVRARFAGRAGDDGGDGGPAQPKEDS